MERSELTPKQEALQDMLQSVGWQAFLQFFKSHAGRRRENIMRHAVTGDVDASYIDHTGSELRGMLSLLAGFYKEAGITDADDTLRTMIYG